MGLEVLAQIGGTGKFWDGHLPLSHSSSEARNGKIPEVNQLVPKKDLNKKN